MKLANLAHFMPCRENYDAITFLLDRIGIEVRYSLNASHNYFRSNETYDFYNETIANQHWINSVQEHLNILIDYCQDSLTGSVNLEFEAFSKIEDAFNDLMKKSRK